MRLRDVKVGMKVSINGALGIATVDELLSAFKVNKWSSTVRIKRDGLGYLVNHRDLRPYVEPKKKPDSQPLQPEIRLPADPTEAAIRVIEYRIAKVRKESSDKICALESTIEELRKGWKP